MTLLAIVQDVCGRLSLPQPSAVVGSTDKQVIQLFELANEEGQELAARHPWQSLTREATFATVNAPGQAGALPADFDRFAPNSFFNRSTRRPMTGPVTPKEWQWIQAQPVYSSAYLAFRERTGQFLIAPTPAAGQTIAYEYVSTNWAQSSGGTAQPAFLADSDTALLSEELIRLGLRWRFLRAKGLDYAEELAGYERRLEQAMARDGGSTALTLSPQPIDPNRINIPDGNYGA